MALKVWVALVAPAAMAARVWLGGGVGVAEADMCACCGCVFDEVERAGGFRGDGDAGGCGRARPAACVRRAGWRAAEMSAADGRRAWRGR